MNIYVGNLSYGITEEDLRALFAEFGDVSSAKLIIDRETNRSKGFGFVEMSSNDAANKAIDELNGREGSGRAEVRRRCFCAKWSGSFRSVTRYHFIFLSFRFRPDK